MWFCNVIIFLLISSIYSHSEFREVSLPQGRVRGFLSEDGRRYSYTGIPYATTPLGENRFKAPLPAPSWKSILNANITVQCPQIGTDKIYTGKEDCLVINIFTSALTQLNDSIPVLAFIHGGGFVQGSGTIVEKNRLIDEGVIIVTFNYRIGMLGFLCFGTEDAPGNAGLKDQIAALKWIQDNIRSFGGNPDSVTIYGASAGSVSAELLVLSDAAVGLFKGVILESGSALTAWGMSYTDPIVLARNIVNKIVRNKTRSVKELLNIYLSLPAEDLVKLSNNYTMSLKTPVSIAPCIERNLDNVAVLINSPINILSNGIYNKVPIMIVYMSMDGYLFADFYKNAGWDDTYRTSAADLLYKDLKFQNKTQKQEASRKIFNFYSSRKDGLLSFTDFMTDYLFFYPAATSAKLHAKNGVPLYLTEFTYHDNSSSVPGAIHGDVVSNVFEESVVGEFGEKTVDKLVSIFGSFIKTRNPSSTGIRLSWPTFTVTNKTYLIFDDELTISHTPRPKSYKFWDEMYKEHYNKLSVPGVASVDNINTT